MLVALPIVVFGVPAMLGHAVLLGDDVTQNFPLRVLAGQLIRAGQLPVFDPWIWSGAPLLAGWNAGAAYPLTWLFAILPATLAWTAGLIVTWAVAGLGMYWFLRALRLGRLASFLGALSFAWAGAMPAQVSHFGLVAGMSWVPLMLLAVLRLCQDRLAGSRLGWTAILAATTGLMILAGEPRAVDDACVIAAAYTIWQVARLGRRCGPAAVSVGAGLVLGACLGAVQWLPGMSVISTSQRAAGSMALYSSGSLPVRWLLLTLVPDLLGGSGSFGQPGFFAGYNLTEVTSYVGILPLVAAFALLARLRLRPRLPEWAIWHVIAAAGAVLALGGFTPVGRLLYRLPLFGDQRLQSRNILVLDLALAVLLAWWVDEPRWVGQFRSPDRFLRERFGRKPALGGLPLETVLGAVPALAVVAVAVTGLAWGADLLGWLGIGPARAASVIGQLRPWLEPFAVLGVAALVLVLLGQRLRPRALSRLLAGFVAVDLVVFIVLCVVAVSPGRHGSPANAAASGASATGGSTTGGNATGGNATTARPVAALGYPGRFAIYDPGLLDAGQLSALEPPDANGTGKGAMPSVQGYTSLADGRYAAATGSHLATGEGQDVLSPRAVADGTLDELDTSVLLTLPAYLVTSGGDSAAAAGPAGTGRRDLAAGQRSTWYLGRTVEIARVSVPDPDARRDAAAGARIGLMAPGGPVRWFPARAISGSTLAITLPRPVTAVAVTGQAGRSPGLFGAPAVVTQAGTVLTADGQLQDALVPPRWALAGFDGSFAVFADHFARGPLTVQALPGRSAAGARITAVTGTPGDPQTATVVSPHGVRVIRSVAAIPGWTATWHPERGPAVTLTVQRDGIVQAVAVPAGSGVLTWNYTTPGFPAGLAMSAAALVALLALAALGLLIRPDGQPRPVATAAAAMTWLAGRPPPVRTGSLAPPGSRESPSGGNRWRPRH
jgi:hypothetical protein